MALNFPQIFSDKKQMNDTTLHGNLPLMRAKVVRNTDPKQIGRVQVRIPSFHGVPGLTDRFIEDEDLPWATPCFYGGCGQDMGSFIVPIPGTYVWLMFEDNDSEKPVYIGGVPSVGSTKSKQINNLDDPESDLPTWETTPGMADVAWDEFDGKDTLAPERSIIYKSIKGHTIMCDDTDGEESMTFIDRVGQVIKFICGVTKGKNEEKYRRELNSAQTDSQLGEGLVEEPSIMIRSGETKDAEKVHSMFRMFRNHMRTESIDLDAGKQTTTDYSPTEFNQQTQESIINMTEDHIYISYPNILEYFCKSYWSLKAFDNCLIKCTEDSMLFQYNGNGLYIDGESLKLTFGDTTLIETTKDLKVKASDLFEMDAAGAKIQGSDGQLSGSAQEFKFEGSGSIYTDGDKTYITGTEIHFNK